MNKVKIGIIGGKGKMGQYFKAFFEKNGYEVLISDRGSKLSNIQLAKKADVVVVSVPIGHTQKVLEEVTPHLKKGSLLMDLTSLKQFPMEIMKGSKGDYLGCHPLFGPTNNIEGQMVILCKGRGAKWYKWWKELLEKNRVEVHEMGAKEHDDLMAYVQSLSHFSDLVLADALRASGIDIESFLKYQSPPYRLKLNMMGRILNQDPNLYAHIQVQNAQSLKVMNSFKEMAEDWIDLVKNKNIPHFEKRFKQISKYLGDYKKQAMEESDFIIEQINRRKLVGEAEALLEPDSSFDLVVLGPKNTFSSLAAKKYSPKAKIYYAISITEIFEILKKGKIKKAMVPVENKLAGSVAETLTNLFESSFKIEEEFVLPIHHTLVALDDVKKKGIKAIYSHPQPIKQCKKYLQKHFPKAELIQVASTTAAVQKIIDENNAQAAAICSEEAAEAFNMQVLDENIEDYAFNETRFFILGKNETPYKKGQSYKTSIAFYFSADAPGTLYEVLGEISNAGANMTKIESLANPEIPGGYVFYIDFEGHVKGSSIKKMLGNVKGMVKELRVMGSY